MLRAFLDGILEFIDSVSLTDDEFDSLPPGLTADYNAAVYEGLKGVLQQREGVSSQLIKLKAYFVARGVEITDPARTPASQISVGFAL